MKRRMAVRMREVIASIRDLYREGGVTAVYLDNGWCLYSEGDEITLESICYIDEYPELNGDDEVYSEYITDNKLELVYRDELLQDVIISCMQQKDTVTYDEILEAIKYYDENDTFLRF